MTEVRTATMDDRDAIVATVVAAFRDDPAWEYMVGAGTPAAAAFARALLVPRLEAGTAWVALSDGAVGAVAMWDRAAPEPRGGSAEWWAAFADEVGPEVAARVDRYDAVIKTKAPARPYWYLGVLATHPDVQGRGLATAVVQPAFARAEQEGWDCWLETSKPANKDFYRRRGFTDSVEVDFPDGPPTWWMRRPHAG